MCNFVKSSSLPGDQQHLTFHMTWTKPKTYKQASKEPLWFEAMEKELHALTAYNTWEVINFYLKVRKLLSVDGFTKSS